MLCDLAKHVSCLVSFEVGHSLARASTYGSWEPDLGPLESVTTEDPGSRLLVRGFYGLIPDPLCSWFQLVWGTNI